MPEIWGIPQSDPWLRARCGRVTGSQMPKASKYLSRASGDKKAGDSSGVRDTYRRALIGERLTGRLANHWESDYMARGNEEEEPARAFYEIITRQNVIPVSFIVHEEFPFFGATADGRIGREGVAEFKNPETAKHIQYLEEGLVPEEYMPQVASEIACAGKECRFAAFMSFDRRIQDGNLCYFLKTTGRDELEWTVGSGAMERKLTGEAVIDYFTNEAIKMDAEVKQFLAEHGVEKAVAPFEVIYLNEPKAEPELSAEEAYAAALEAVESLGVDTP